MANSIFENTMADMKWKEIKDFADKNAIVLLPLGVIEEHGSHLPLGTDIYLAYTQSVLTKSKLSEKNITAIIAPPFYWGVSEAVACFPGTFTAREETVKAIIFDIVMSLSRSGFNYVYGINVHGEIAHSKALIASFKEVSEKINITACYTIAQEFLEYYGLNGDESYILPIEPRTIEISTSKYKEIHADAEETAAMIQYHRELVDINRAKTLSPIQVEDSQISKWIDGSEAKNLTPDGYWGAPANFIYVDAKADYNDTAFRIANAIARRTE